MQQGGGFILLENKSPTLVARNVILDRVRQTTCRTDKRYCTVSQAHKLPQSAGLKARRHKKHVAARVNPLGKGGVKADKGFRFGRIFRLKLLEERLIFRLAGSKNYNLYG